MKSHTMLVTALAALLVGDAPTALAQSSTPSSRLSFGWGSDASITLLTNGVSTGIWSSQMIAGGSSYTSDLWTINILFNSGTVSIDAVSSQRASLNWSMNWSMDSAQPVTDLLFSDFYQANNGESMSLGSVTINGVPVSGSATVDGSQNYSQFEINYGSAITSVSYDMAISTPNTWQRQAAGGPPYPPGLLATVTVPEIATTPEPSTISLGLIGSLAVLFFKKKART